MTEEKDPNKLDRSRTFGTVFGDPHVGYVQDNRNFKHDGTLYIPTENPAASTTVNDPSIPREVLKLRNDKFREAYQKKGE